MKKVITLVLVGLLAFAIVGPAEAKKKKPKPAPAPVDVQFFIRVDEACEAPFLSVTDGDDGDCLYTDGGLFDVYQATGLLDTVRHHVAVDGVPLTLDPARKVVGSFAVVGWNGTGIGAAELDVTLIATIAGEEKELGTYSESYIAGPNHVQQVDFEMELDPALAGAVVEGLTLDIWTHGVLVGGRDVERDASPAFIKVPAVQ